MRIGYFGGSFDPPHRGHLAVAHAAAAAFALDTILFVPTGQQPLKPAGSLASYADRLAMVRLLCLEASAQDPTGPAFRESTLEAPRPDSTPNYTVDTLRALRGTLAADDQLFVLLGADAFLQVPHWRSPEELLRLADWIIVSRPGVDLERLRDLPLFTGTRDRIHLLPTVQHPASATLLRAKLGKNTAASELLESLPIAVWEYICEHHLYAS